MTTRHSHRLPPHLPTSLRSHRRWRGVAVLACTVLALSACGGGDDDRTETSTGSVLHDGVVDAKLQGTWRVLGQGQLFEWDSHGIKAFQEVKSLCYQSREMPFSNFLDGASYRHVKTGNQVTVDLYETASTPSSLTLEKIPKIPDNCRKTPPSDPLTVFQAMWDMFDLDYGFFKERNIDWPARYAALKPQAAAARNDDDLEVVLTAAIQGFNDYHVDLSRLQGDEVTSYVNSADTPTYHLERQAFAQQSAIETFDDFEAQWRESMQAATASRLSGGSEKRLLNGAMTWGKLPGNIGYIELSRLSEFSEDSTSASDLQQVGVEMDRAIAALADTRALIVDIAVNDGGYDTVSAEVAGRFANSRRLAFTVQQHRPQGRPTQSWFVEPKGPRQYLKPVYLLTTDRTVSASDTLTLMMRRLPHVTQVGQPTSGSMSNKLAKFLPGGNFMVSLSNESYIDPDGVLYEGRGIPAQIPVQVFDPANPASLYTGHEVALDKVLALIGR